MKYAADLHVHTALSPCSDNDMTPNNIVNISELKGLDFVAITDHNSTGNLSSVQKCAYGKNVLVVPGIEIETAEEVHLICLFSSMRDAFEVGRIVEASLPAASNREDIFGSQLLMDEHDRITGKVDKMLMSATNLTVADVFEITDKANGVVIPAHIDRECNSLLFNLGAIPEELDIKYAEASFKMTSKELSDYHVSSNINIIRTSDAHKLGDILEREFFIELKEKSVSCLISALKAGDAEVFI
jgi:PHP family Zn ribbon phosphoesterase